MRKYARFEGVQVLDLKGSSTRVKNASLQRVAEFDDYRTEDGYLYARIRAISSRVNKNHDGWPSVEIAGGKDVFDKFAREASAKNFTRFAVEADGRQEYGYSTFLGKPIFVDHHNSDPSRARGVIVDSKLHVEDHRTSASLDPYYASAPDNHLPPTWVELLLEVDAKSFPRLAKAIIEGSRNPKKGIDGFSMGCDVEKSICNICKNAATSPDQFCHHVQMKGAHFDYIDPKTGKKTSKRSYEDCYGIKFFEISAVFDPADETALTREVRAGVHQEAGMDDESSGLTPYNILEGDEKGNLDSGTYPPELHNAQGEQAIHQILQKYDAEATDPERLHTLTGYVMRDLTQAGVAPDIANQAVEEWANEKRNLMDQSPGDLTLPQEWTAAVAHHVVASMRHRADNPPPQSDLTHAPEPIDTLREEKICDVCGSDMDGPECDVCGWIEPPKGFNNPDLSKAHETDLRQEEQDGEPGGNELELGDPSEQADSLAGEAPSPTNPPLLAHVTNDMEWEISHTRLAGVNPVERPLSTSQRPATNEPSDQVVKDQPKPVTSSVRTASDFIAAAGATNRRNMQTTADAASGAPAVAKPDTNVDVDGVGGVQDASNEQASKAEAQVDVLNKGGTGVEGVAAEKTVNVEQGNEHSKNIEAIPTKTFDDGSSGVERQADPVSGEPFPASDEGVKSSAWTIEALDSGPFPPTDESAGGGGSAVQGVQPIDAVGRPDERVNVLDPTTTPANNSGPTTQWTGTDGNGVNRQQDPVTQPSIAQGESGLESSPNWTKANTTSHLLTAMKLADLEIELGLLDKEKKYARIAELEQLQSPIVEASLHYAKRVKTAGLKPEQRRVAKRLPVFGRNSHVEAEERTSSEDEVHDSALFS